MDIDINHKNLKNIMSEVIGELNKKNESAEREINSKLDNIISQVGHINTTLSNIEEKFTDLQDLDYYVNKNDGCYE